MLPMRVPTKFSPLFRVLSHEGALQIVLTSLVLLR
jgi:hypothetical protein